MTTDYTLEFTVTGRNRREIHDATIAQILHFDPDNSVHHWNVAVEAKPIQNADGATLMWHADVTAWRVPS